MVAILCCVIVGRPLLANLMLLTRTAFLAKIGASASLNFAFSLASAFGNVGLQDVLAEVALRAVVAFERSKQTGAGVSFRITEG